VKEDKPKPTPGKWYVEYPTETLECDTMKEVNHLLAIYSAQYPKIVPKVYFKEPGGLRHILHVRSGGNAPKRQPCPKCGGWRKRRTRTATLATYQCNPCNLSHIVSLRGSKG